MNKNATYLSKFTLDEFVKICSDYMEEKFLTDITASEFAILMNKSTGEAGRAQLSIFICCVNAATHEPKEEFICIRKLSTSKTSETIMNDQNPLLWIRWNQCHEWGKEEFTKTYMKCTSLCCLYELS